MEDKNGQNVGILTEHFLRKQFTKITKVKTTKQF